VNSFSGLRADVIWGSANDYQGVFLWPDNTSASQGEGCLKPAEEGSGGDAPDLLQASGEKLTR
jgi:hypothetical protein